MFMENNLDIIAHAYNGIKHDNSVPDGKITEAKLAEEIKTKLNGNIKYTEQTLTEEQQTQARENIDALGNSDLTSIEQRIDEVEEVTGTALCDLNGRINENSTVIDTKANKSKIVNVGSNSLSVANFKWFPNIFYKFETVANLTIYYLMSPVDTTVVNEYMLEFISGSTPTTLSLPSSIKGIDATSIEANKKYHISIVNNVGVIYGVDNA